MRIAFRTAGHKAKHRPNPQTTTYVITVAVEDIPIEDRHDQIKRVFESPLGPYVSEATLTNERVLIVLHVAFDHMRTVYRQLATLFPEGVIKNIYPRTPEHLRHGALS